MASGLLSISKKDIGDRYWIDVKLAPDVPRDKLMQSQLVQAYRQPGSDGKPFMSDLDIARMIDVAHPEEVRERVDLQLYEATSTEVQDLKGKALWALWKQEHKDMVRLAEKVMADEDAEWEDMKRTLSREDFDKLVQFKVEAELMKKQGIDPNQAAAQQQQMMAMQQSQQSQSAMIPSTVQPPGPMPQAQPSQEMMTGAEQGVGFNPAPTEARQARRGRPHNKP